MVVSPLQAVAILLEAAALPPAESKRGAPGTLQMTHIRKKPILQQLLQLAPTGAALPDCPRVNHPSDALSPEMSSTYTTCRRLLCANADAGASVPIVVNVHKVQQAEHPGRKS